MMGFAPVLDVEDGLSGGMGLRAVTWRRPLAYFCAAALVIALAATGHSIWRGDRGIAEQTGGTYSDFEGQSSSQDIRLHGRSGDPHPARGGWRGFAPPPPPPPHTGATISVDLGGSYSYAGVWSGGAIADTELIVGVTGQHAMSSFVAHNGSGFHVAQPHEPKAIFDAKYLLGQRFSKKEFENLTARLPFHVQQKERHPMMPALDTAGKEVLLHPEVAAAETLFQVKAAASAHLGQEVTGAVLTVPVWFNDQQRQAVKDAGSVAGLNILRIAQEPTAAATAYGLDLQDDKYALVFHCGASSFYITLLSFGSNITEDISEVSDPRLTGRAFDQRLLEHVLAEYQREHGHEAPEDERFRYQLLRHVETAKRELSSVVEVGIEVEAPDGFPNVSVTITRDRFEELAEDLFEVASESLERVNEEVGLELVDDLVFSGGSMHIPKLRTLVGEALGKTARQGIEPEEVIARGAAIIAGRPIPHFYEPCCPEVTELTISVEVAGGLMQPLIKHGSLIPISKRMLLTTMAENQTSLQLRIFQGFRPLAKHNRFITEVNLTGITRAAAEGARVLLQLDIDDDKILHVFAFDLLGGHSAGTTVAADAWFFLGDDEIWKMIEIWHGFAAEDKAAVEELQSAGHARCWPSLKQIPLSEEIPYIGGDTGSTALLPARPSTANTVVSSASLSASPDHFEARDHEHGTLVTEVAAV